MNRTRKLILGAVAGALVAGGGAAIAATQLGGSSGVDSQAVINDAAQQLGVDPAKLSDALKKALADQIDALVTSGRLSQAEADALKARIQSGDVPLFDGGHFGFGRFGDVLGGLDAAASYLGISTDTLRSELESGKTLAEVAKGQSKSVDGLVSALQAPVKTKLDAAVSAGQLTKAREDAILSEVKQRITDFVNGTAGGPGFRHGFFHGERDHLWRGRPSFSGPTA
jgi:uncharacterized protein YidB (DUF937 family)